MRLQGKVALITGGSSGIGLATAKLFIAEGAKVGVTGRDPDKLAEVERQLGPNAVAIRADVLEPGGAEDAVSATLSRFGGLDIVFANAGISGSTPLGGTEAATFDRILRTNLTGVFLTAQAALPHLKTGASIILNGSVMAVMGFPGSSAYAATKAGVRAMARVLASELAPKGIRVNLVVPGATRTPIWSDRAPTPEAMGALEGRLSLSIPLGRLGEAEDIARAALYLASEDARHVTAAEIVVDGGSTGAPAGAPIFRG